MKFKRTNLAGAALICLSASVASGQRSTITIAAAADLKFAMDSIVSAFKAKNAETQIQIIYGSSGKFFEQILQEAPFDLFFSADMDYPNKLRAQGMTLGEIRTYGTGRIVLWSKKTDPRHKGMQTLLDKGVKKISIANPAHAPYGKRAEESLKYFKLYDTIRDKLVFGENISQAAQFVTTGSADIGIVALSLALSPAMQKEGGSYYLIPEKSHAPLDQAYSLLKHAGGNISAQKFYAFISSPTAAGILQYYGFSQKTR